MKKRYVWALSALGILLVYGPQLTYYTIKNLSKDVEHAYQLYLEDCGFYIVRANTCVPDTIWESASDNFVVIGSRMERSLSKKFQVAGELKELINTLHLNKTHCKAELDEAWLKNSDRFYDLFNHVETYNNVLSNFYMRWFAETFTDYPLTIK